VSKKTIKNIAASIRQKLLNKAQENNRPFNEILQYYALERFLYRLSTSSYADKFILKGALLFTVWQQPETRSTVDIDLLGKISNDPETVTKVFQEICEINALEDGLRFDSASVTSEQITVDADYQGVRVRLYGYLNKARFRIQIDIGFSDIITPSPEKFNYPTILHISAPKLNCYNKETCIAEKLQAMVKLNILNSRMKDFYDIWILSERFEFTGSTLKESIKNTFQRRETEIREDIITFLDVFCHNDEKIKQWKGFLRKARVQNIPEELEEIIRDIKRFLNPIITSIVSGEEFTKTWKPKKNVWQ
jgi:predicted nucleotidyltransferase component of viral defense system